MLHKPHSETNLIEMLPTLQGACDPLNATGTSSKTTDSMELM
jgi:hypothetical protein